MENGLASNRMRDPLRNDGTRCDSPKSEVFPNYKIDSTPPPMTTDLKQLLNARAELDAQIAHARAQESRAALAQIHAWIDDFGFTAQQVFPWKTPATKTVTAKYLDEKTGATWTGRGKPPAWIRDKNKNDFLIDQPKEPASTHGPLLAEMAAAAYRNRRR